MGGKLAERLWRVDELFKRLQCTAEPGDQIGSGGQLGIGQCVARVGAMQAVFALAKGLERVGQAVCSSARTRPAQDRTLERGDCALPVRQIEPQQRMFEERQQRYRLKAVKSGLGRELRKNSRRCIGQCIAAGILGRNIPARQRGQHAASERAVRRDQRGRLAVVHRFAQRHRDGECFVLGIGRFDHRERAQRGLDMRLERRIGGLLPPHVGRGSRPQRFR